MNAAQPKLSWLSDPEVFAVNRKAAHSDHLYYETIAQARAEEEMSLRQSLNGPWYFAYAKNPSQCIQDFYKADFNCRSFDTITVPGHIQTQGYDTMMYVNTQYPWDGVEMLRPPHISEEYNPVGSYVRYFEVNEQLKGKPLSICFEGVEIAFYVWLNGHFVGYSEDTFTPSEFALDEYLVDGENKLAVEVYKRSSASWIEDQDFWRFSGIFRDVYLYAVPETHAQDLFVKATLDGNYENGLLDITGKLSGKLSGTVTVALEDWAGETVYTASAPVAEEIHFCAEIEKPDQWSAEAPNLYQLLVIITDEDDNVVEAIPMDVGFRTFEMKDGVMLINGKRILFRGVNRHEFNCKTGRVITEEDMLWDVQFMKRCNLNAVRTCHYPNQSLWYKLCDRYGLYMIDETNMESHGSWWKAGVCDPEWNVPGSNPQWQACVLDRANSMFQRDKNHASILMWSCGNESYAGECIANMTRFFHEVDPTRLVHYEGCFWNREFDHCSDMESRMYAKPQEIDAYLAANPAKPYISCEFLHCMGNSGGNLNMYMALEEKYEKYQGGFIWDYMDQAVEAVNDQGEKYLAYGGDHGERPTDYEFCTNGLVYADRTVSPKAQEVKHWFSNIKLFPDDQGVLVKNENRFISTEGDAFIYRLLKDGEAVFADIAAFDVPAMASGYFALPWPELSEPGEYTFEVSAVLKEDTAWAEEGYEVAFGQFVTQVEGEVIPCTKGVTLIEDGWNIGVRGEGFHVMFSRGEGGISSLRYEGKEFIPRAPKTTFWRATTDNDRGCKHGFDRGMWLGASMFQKVVKTSVTHQDAYSVTVTMEYEIPTTPVTRQTIHYTVTGDGAITLEAIYHGGENLPSLPCFGMQFKLKEQYHNFAYYGLGPEENYWDRMDGARLGIYGGTAAGNMPGYLVPGECGNRMDTRWLTVTDDNGRGLSFEAVDAPFQSSVLPYSNYEMECCLHTYELPKPHYTWVRILGCQMGIGGDDTWGAPVQEDYWLDSSQERRVKFTIRPV